MTTNPFAQQAAKARETEESSREAAAANAAAKRERARQRREALQAQKEASRIKAALYRFTQSFTDAVGRGFARDPQNPKKPWRSEDIDAAGEYVVYLTTPFVSSTHPQAPTIKAAHAAAVREKFVWGLLIANSSGAPLPDDALVGQLEDWFPELTTKRLPVFTKWQDSKRPKAVEETITEKEEPDVETDGQAEDLSPEKLSALADRFRREHAKVVVELRPAITAKRSGAKQARRGRNAAKRKPATATVAQAS